MRSANLDPKVNLWNRVFDFNDELKVANHWRLWDESKEVKRRMSKRYAPCGRTDLTMLISNGFTGTRADVVPY